MKILIASDIHGSAEFCKKMIDVFNENNCEKLFLLGDILYHGPRNNLPSGHGPMEVAEMLNKMSDKIVAVKGNCDAEIDECVLDFPLQEGYKIENVDGKKFFLTHGHMWNDENLPPLGVCDVMLFGHIHVPVDKMVEDIHILNPGSTSIPKGGSKNSCLLYEDGEFRFIEL